jgi:hypothetical protein
VGQQLGFVDWMNPFFAFQFHDDPVFHEQIRTETALQFHVLINQRNSLLLDDN